MSTRRPLGQRRRGRRHRPGPPPRLGHPLQAHRQAGRLGQASPSSTPPGLKRIARGFTVSHEKRSTTRYVADSHLHLQPRGGGAGDDGCLAHTIASPRRPPHPPDPDVADLHPQFGVEQRLLEPALRRQPGALRGADRRGADVVALERLQFDSATWADVQLVAARIHASEAVLALAVPLTQGGTSTTDKMTGKVQICSSASASPRRR
ncbi:MAG: hypothetical protein WDM81_08570 [Rhizomicrobium sp.]